MKKQTYSFLKFLKLMLSCAALIVYIFFFTIILSLFHINEMGPFLALIFIASCIITISFFSSFLEKYFINRIKGYKEFKLAKQEKEEQKRQAKIEAEELKKAIEYEVQNEDIAYFEMVGSNQAFNTGVFSGITYNKTEYTVRITYNSGRTRIQKVDEVWLNNHSDLLRLK